MSSSSAAGGASSDGHGAEPEELTVFVQNLLAQMQSRFQAMSDAIISKVDEMGARVDDLEKAISELMVTAGGGGAGSSSSSSAGGAGAGAAGTGGAAGGK